MKLDIAQQWTAALRSGDYQQGVGALHRKDDTYCCLGVLCDLAAKEGITERKDGKSDELYFYAMPGTTAEGHTAYLPESVREWAGMSFNDGTLVLHNSMQTSKGGFLGLAGANDEGVPFSEIADLIEKHAEYL